MTVSIDDSSGSDMIGEGSGPEEMEELALDFEVCLLPIGEKV